MGSGQRKEKDDGKMGRRITHKELDTRSNSNGYLKQEIYEPPRIEELGQVAVVTLKSLTITTF